jgi:hypothetical protein
VAVLSKVVCTFPSGEEEEIVGPCLQVLNDLAETPLSLTYKFLDVLPEQNLSPEARSRYLNFLRMQGFIGFDDYQYVRNTEELFNIREWISTFYVLRYTYEQTRLINWWDTKVYHEQRGDPWIVFALGHCCSIAYQGHSLMHNQATSLPIPSYLLSSLRQQHTGWMPPAYNHRIHELWCGAPYRYAADSITTWDELDARFDGLYTHLSSILTQRTA